MSRKNRKDTNQLELLNQVQLDNTNNELKINLISPDTREVRFSERHPVFMRILTVELIIAAFALFAYMYVYSYKASYLNYFGIPHYYTEVTIAEMLNSSWLVVTFIEMFLFAIFAIMAISAHRIVLEILKNRAIHTKWKKCGFLLLSYFVVLLICSIAYYFCFQTTDQIFEIWGISSNGKFDPAFALHDILTFTELPFIPIIIVCGYSYLQFRKRQKQPLLTSGFLMGFIFSLFFFFVFAYSHSVIQGETAAKYNRTYSFIVEDNTITNQMIIGTYREQYIIVYLKEKKQPTKTFYQSQNFNVIDDSYQLIPIKEEDAPKVDVSIADQTKNNTEKNESKKDEIRFIRLQLKYGVTQDLSTSPKFFDDVEKKSKEPHVEKEKNSN